MRGWGQSVSPRERDCPRCGRSTRRTFWVAGGDGGGDWLCACCADELGDDVPEWAIRELTGRPDPSLR